MFLSCVLARACCKGEAGEGAEEGRQDRVRQPGEGLLESLPTSPRSGQLLGAVSRTQQEQEWYQAAQKDHRRLQTGGQFKE